MKKANPQNKLKKSLIKAHKIYHSWEEQLHCPALESQIRITRSGWNHIAKSKERKKEELLLRLEYIYLAPTIIKKTTTVQRETIQHKRNGTIKTWSFLAVESGNLVEIVIRQIGNQPKHFYSFVYKGRSPRIIKQTEKAVSSLRG